MRFWCLSSLIVAALAALVGQEPEPRADQPIFRTSSTLATVDVVAVDDEGRHVAGLTKNDFHVAVRGKRQELQQVVYVPGTSTLLSPQGTESERDGRTTSPTASAILKRSGLAPDRITRTLAFIIDDLNLSFESTYYVRKALTRYVETEMGPDFAERSASVL